MPLEPWLESVSESVARGQAIDRCGHWTDPSVVARLALGA